MLATLTLAAHLLAMNVAAGGPLVCIWLHRRAFRDGDAAADTAGRRLAGASLLALLVGTLLGFVSFAINWASDSEYLPVLRQVPAAKYGFALAELAFSVVLMAVYWRLWGTLARRRFWHGLLALAASTNLLYHFPPLLAAVAKVRAHPELATQLALERTADWLRDPVICSRTIHVWLASVATAGLTLTGIALRSGRRENAPARYGALAAWGGRIALAPTLLQLVVGLWVTMALPEASVEALLGGDVLAALLLGASLLASFGLLHMLSAISFGEPQRPVVVGAMALLTLIVVLMTGTLRRLEHLPRAAAATTAMHEEATIVSEGRRVNP